MLVSAPAGWGSDLIEPPDLRAQMAALPAYPDRPLGPAGTDWLVHEPAERAMIFRHTNGVEVVMDNSLIRRVVRLVPNGATVAFDNLMTGASLLRAVKPEAQIGLNGQSCAVGGLVGQPDHAFLLPEWRANLREDPKAFRLAGLVAGQPQAPFAWKRRRRAADLPWPPRGVALAMRFEGRDERTRGVAVTLHFELYDGLPVLGKWLTISNQTSQPLTLDSLTTELLAAVEAESAVDARATNRWRLPAVSVLSDYSFGGMDPTTASRVTRWLPDPDYLTQVHYERKTPVLLACSPPTGPGVVLGPGQSFESFRVFLVVHDSDDRERQGLALRRAQRALAPWITENPIMLHLRYGDSQTFRRAVDQCAAVGFEMIIYSFGSGLNMEDDRPEYLARIRADVDYAHAKGLEVGAYSLLSSRRIDDENDVINPTTGRPGGAIFGNAPCLGSRWGQDYLRKVRHFLTQTGLDLLEHDGPYPGDVCASTNHPGHRGLADSQWTQWRASVEFYRWCRAQGLYVNAPDYYFLAGTSKTGMGYREDNWSLPRAQQLLHGRQNIFDGTWEKTPTMGWMFVPLTEYQGGGAAATLEPLSEHLDDYAAHLANNLGAGVQACYRGPRLYDTETTRAVVEKWVTWFKRYRDILESDLIHLRRADGRDLDYFLHANPKLKTQGLLMVYNPLDQPVARPLLVPLYYTGLTSTAFIREGEGKPRRYRLDARGRVEVPVKVRPRGCTWFVIEGP